MTKTLLEPTADQQIERIYNTGMAVSEQKVLEADTKYALCLLKLHSSVTPDQYPALKAAIEAVSGVQEISLVIDHQTRATVPDGKQLKVVMEFNLRLDPIPEP